MLKPLVYFFKFLGPLLRDYLLIVASLALLVWNNCFCIPDGFCAVFPITVGYFWVDRSFTCSFSIFFVHFVVGFFMDEILISFNC